MSYTHSVMFKPEDARWYNPARREFTHSWGVWSVWHFITRLHQHNPCHSQDMELSFTPEKLTLTTTYLSASLESCHMRQLY